jgi:hypothetical protein
LGYIVPLFRKKSMVKNWFFAPTDRLKLPIKKLLKSF